MKCLLFAVFLAGVVYCVFANAVKKANDLPTCYRNFTDKEIEDKKALWKECKGPDLKELKELGEKHKTMTEDEKKELWKKFEPLFVCILEKKAFLKDNKLVPEALEAHIKDVVLPEHQKGFLDLFNLCKDKTEMKEYFKCCHEKKKADEVQFTCNPHKHNLKKEAEAEEKVEQGEQ